MSAPDLAIDVEDRDLIFDRVENDALTVDLEDRDFILDPADGDVAVEFGAVGLPGPSAFQLWLADGNVGTIDDFLAAGGGVTGEILEAKLAIRDALIDQVEEAAIDGDAALASELEEERLARLSSDAALLSSDVSTANRIDHVEQAVGADPGDLTLLFENGLI